MPNAAVLEQHPFACASEEAPRSNQTGDAQTEAAEVAKLLARAGVDQASSLWFQLLELATQHACDWAECSSEFGAPLSPRAAAILGLRSLAADLMTSAAQQDDFAQSAVEALLSVCAEGEAGAASAPQRRRRWGEGATPKSPSRPDLLQRSAGCC